MTLTVMAALVVFVSPAEAQKKTPLVVYNAVAANPVTQESARVVIQLYEWTTDEEDEALHQALIDGGSEALWNLLNKQPEKARIRVTGEMEERIQYARKHQNADGTETIVLGADRPVGFTELFDALRTRDFNISLGALQLDPGTGKGTGVIVVGADIREGKDGQFIMEAFGTQPINLRSVTTKIPKQKKK
jgi:hypothetical protein